MKETGFIGLELEEWEKRFQFRYVDLVEDLLNAALTSYDPVSIRLTGTYARRSFAHNNGKGGG